jgi:hypothetical protein
MPTITRISASIGGRVTGICTVAPVRGIMAAATPTPERIFVIHDKEVLSLLRQAQIVPPQREGETLSVAETDRKLANLDVSQRFLIKNTLRSLGIL